MKKYFSLRKKKEIVKKFIYTIFKCIYIKPEDILHIPLDFKNHHLEIIQSDKNLEIKANKRNNNNKTFLKFKFKQEDNEFWYHDIDSEIIKNSLKLKYETLYELETVYPIYIRNKHQLKFAIFIIVNIFIKETKVKSLLE